MLNLIKKGLRLFLIRFKILKMSLIILLLLVPLDGNILSIMTIKLLQKQYQIMFKIV